VVSSGRGGVGVAVHHPSSHPPTHAQQGVLALHPMGPMGKGLGCGVGGEWGRGGGRVTTGLPQGDGGWGIRDGDGGIRFGG